MIVTSKFNKVKDIGLVFEGLAPDINDLIENHKIGDVSSDVVYNEISKIEEVGVRINDDFDLYKYYKQFNDKFRMSSNGGTGSSQGPLKVQE